MSEHSEHPTLKLVHKVSEGFHQAQHDDEQHRTAAAVAIQRAWRQNKGSIQKQYLSSDVRWKDVAMHAKLRVERSAADEGKNTAKERWRRGAFFAKKLRDGNMIMDQAGSKEGVPSVQKQLETQHWLELIDAKHRYGSNLKASLILVHKLHDKPLRGLPSIIIDIGKKQKRKTISSDDHGDGKDLSLNECSREQLEKERITYLSAEQRLNYLVKIDHEGKLRWARNDELVDTSPGHWKDSGTGEGIVPEDMPERSVNRRGSFQYASSTSSSDSEAAMHYIEPLKGKNSWSRVFNKYFTIRGMTNRLLRKTVQRNTWIYVSDTNYNLFIGIKNTGTFQHSTLLGGGLVTSAGLISIRDGIIHTLSPLSGHYRTSIDHFHQFIDELTSRGVDMHKAKVSKAEAALWGIEQLGKWKKKQSHAKEAGKKQAAKAGHAIVDALKINDSTWKTDILEGRKRSQESGSGPPLDDGRSTEDRKREESGNSRNPETKKDRLGSDNNTESLSDNKLHDAQTIEMKDV